MILQVVLCIYVPENFMFILTVVININVFVLILFYCSYEMLKNVDKLFQS